VWPCIGSLCLQQLAESFELVSAWDLNSLAKTFWVQSQGNPINILWCNVCFHHKWLAWQIPTVTVTFGVLKGERMWDSIWHLACYKDLRKLPHGEFEYTQCIWVVCSIKVWKTCKQKKWCHATLEMMFAWEMKTLQWEYYTSLWYVMLLNLSNDIILSPIETQLCRPKIWRQKNKMNNVIVDLMKNYTK